MKRLTLRRFFALAALAVALVVTISGGLLVRRARRSVLDEASARQLEVAGRIQREVGDELARASRAIEDLERALVAEAIPFDSAATLEAPLMARLLADPHLEELTFTRGQLEGYDEDGSARLAEAGRFQVAAMRQRDGRLVTRHVERSEAGSFLAEERSHRAELGQPLPPEHLPEPGAPLPAPAAATPRSLGEVTDPTADLTFAVIAERSLRGRLVWSDLHYAEADRHLPQDQRRIVLTAQKAVFDARGQLAGVLRCGLLTDDLDAVAGRKIDPGSADAQRLAVVARTGRGKLELVTRPSPNDRIEPIDGDLRVVPASLPAELAALLDSPLAAKLDAGAERVAGAIEVGGVPWRATITRMPPAIGGIEPWAVAVLVVEEHYTRAVAAAQRQLLLALGATFAALAAIGALSLAVVRRDLGKILTATARMRAFDFAPGNDHSPFADVDDAMAGLERAKTAARAMGRYVPVDLVRRLFEENSEPALGGEPAEISILFTDIEGFTSLAEKLPVSELALRLGEYLEVMTHAIEAHGGTIDKYIGDAVMALWNAPSPVERHAEAACRAVLACQRATEQLYASPRWAGLPPLITRFGLHQSRVLVGHFGSPTRLAYTALGDGVNLAARLEPLGKQYGVQVLVSEDIVAAAGEGFQFRRIDKVAVKGKSRGVEIYELCGPRTDAPAPHLAAYEAAFTAYLARDFAAAAALLLPALASDAPSAALHARCLALIESPPASDWDGVHVARSK